MATPTRLLEQGEVWTYGCTMAVPAHTAGEQDPLVNTATATGDSGGVQVTDDDQHSTGLIHPQIQVAKSGPATAAHGDTLNFSFAVTNPGDTPIGDVALSDDTCAPVSAPVKTSGNQDNFLDPGETWTYACSTGLPAHAAGENDPLVNVATATGEAAGQRPVTDTDEHSTDILHPGIQVVKDGPATAQHQEDMDFTYTVTNTGEVPLDNVVLGDDLCSPLSAPVKTGGDQDNQLEAGELWSYECSTPVPQHSQETDPFVNTATVTAEANGQTVTDDDTHSTDIVHLNDADLRVNKTGPATVAAGGQLTWTVTTFNDGPRDATGVVLADNLPAGTSFVAAGSSPSCSANALLVTCNIGSIAAGSSVAVTIVVQTTLSQAGQQLSNIATADGDQPDPEIDNNTDDHTTTVDPAADLAIDKTAPAQTSTGGQVTYTLAIQNLGPSAATGVTVTDSVPAGLSFAQANPSQGTCNHLNGTVTCNLGTIAANAGAQITIVADVGMGLAGNSVTNIAVVDGNEADPDLDNNADDAVVQVVSGANARADLEVHKRVIDGFPRVGNQLTYRVTVTNNGPDPATGVQLTDTLDQAVDLIDVDTTQGTCTATLPLQCQLGRIQPGATVTLTVIVRLLATGEIENTASAAGTEVDPDLTNNQATATVNVGQTRTSVKLRKRASRKVVRPGQKFNYTIDLETPARPRWSTSRSATRSRRSSSC